MPDGMRHLLRAFSHVEVIGELDFAESAASVTCHYGHVLTYKLGPLANACNASWNFATNICGRTFSLLLRPYQNFTAFTMNLWAEARK